MNKEISSISQSIHTMLQVASQPLIAAHIRPDGDAIASLIGIGFALNNAGKQCQLVLVDGVPSKYKFLDGSQLISKKVQPGYDLVIALDCSDQKRMGESFSGLAVDINIDHHITNENYAKANLVLPEEAATSAILAQYLPKWGFPLTPEISEALLMGILTDTIGFRTSNVSPQTLRVSAELMENGGNLTELYEKALVAQSFPASVLWGLALSRLKKEGKLAWTSITLQDRKEAGYSGKDDADLTNLLSTIEDIDVVVLFNEQNKCKIKISWRSDAGIDVSTIAHRFGGGGHPPASGVEISGNLEEVEEMVLKITKQYLEDQKTDGVKEHGK